MNTIAPPLYDSLIASAQAKANLVDQPVAIVIWNIGESAVSSKLIVCRRGYAGCEDMSEVNALLSIRPHSEILEIVGPTN